MVQYGMQLLAVLRADLLNGANVLGWMAISAALIGLGFGLTAIGIALVIPAGVDWAAGLLDTAVKKGREGAGSAAEVLGDMAGKATHHFGAATKTAKAATSKAAGVVEDAARQVREFTA